MDLLDPDPSHLHETKNPDQELKTLAKKRNYLLWKKNMRKWVILSQTWLSLADSEEGPDAETTGVR